MEGAREIEPNVAIDKDNILKSKFFLIVEKLSSATNIVFSAVLFMTPSLCYLEKDYPGFVGVSDTTFLILTFIDISIQMTYGFLLFKNGLLKDPSKRKPKRCSRSVCSRCAARGQHPKRFKLKYSLVLLATFIFGVYSLRKINIFFKADQTVNFHRLLHLLGFQLNALLSTMVFVFYLKQLELHSGPLETDDDVLETDDDVLESQALLGNKMV